jgi:uncharacterized protein YvpB
MILQFIGREVDYFQLLQLLRIKSYGAPASNIRLLTQLGLTVDYSVSDVEGLFRLLIGGQPVIVFLRTGDLPYWKYQTDHAVVVVGFDDATQSIYLNDPFFDEAAITVPREYFELAWLERDYYYATISG